MAEGGYDPETTNPFDPHGDDHDDDDDRTGLLDRKKQEEEERRRWQEKYSPRRAESGRGEEVGMKHRKQPLMHWPPGHEPTTKTSTSKVGEQETSFIDTPSGNLYTSIGEQRREEIESRTNEKFANPNYEKFISGIDEYDRVYFKLLRGNAKKWYLDGDVGKFPKTLRAFLGRTHEEVNQEAYEKQKDEEEKQAKREQEREKARRMEEEVEEKLYDANERLINLRNSLAEQERARNSVETPEEAESKGESINVIKRSIKSVEGEVKEYTREREESRNARENADARVEEGEKQVETARERVNERLLSLRDRIKEIFKKHGFTVIAVATAVATVIGVIVSNLKAGLTKVAKGVGNGLKELGKKLGEILPGMIGAIASFIFRTAGEAIGFLAKHAWLLIVGLVVLAVEQFKKKSG